MLKLSIPILTVLFAVTLPVQSARAERLPAIDNAFNQPDAGQWFSGWTAGDPALVSRSTEGDAAFVRMSVPQRGTSMIERAFPVDPAWRSVVVAARLRGKYVKPGEQDYETPMVQVIFKDAAGELVGGWPEKLTVRADTDWHVQRHRYTVPAGAASVVTQICVLNSAGTFDVDWITLQPLREGELPDASQQALAWDFEKLGNRWPDGFTRGNPKEISVVEEGGNGFVRVERADKTESAAISNVIVLDPNWAAVTVEARLRMANLNKGDEDWQTGNVQSTFFDAAGKQVGGWPPKLSALADTDWSPRTQRYAVPAGAVSMRLEIGIWGATGRFDVDDLKLTGHQAGELPAGERARWGEEPVVALGAHRGEIVLNGLWRFTPATIKDPQDRNAGWVRVPANWCSTSGPGIVTKGMGWDGIDLNELPAAVYERTIDVPRQWDGRAVVLRLDRVSTDAVVSVDGKRAGDVKWPAGEVDLTSLVSPGKQHALRIEVFATQHDEEVLEFMETMDLQVSRQKSTLATRGLIGDVVLLSRPRGAHLTDVAVETSVRKKQLGVDLELSEVAAAGEARVRVEVLDTTSGATVRTFEGAAQLQAEPTQRVRLAWDWADPKLWDVGQPNLYDLRLTVTQGDGVRDSQLVRFGFREFWSEGRNFILNGVPIRLRPFLAPNGYSNYDGIPASAAGSLASLQKAGFNFVEIWPNDVSRRGSDHTFDTWYREADKLGLLISGVLPSVNSSIVDPNWRQIWQTEQGRPAWQKRVTDHLRGRRNNPAVVMWAISGNFFGHAQDQNPRMLGRRGVYDRKPQRLAGFEAVEWARSMDPTRRIYTHQGADVGDVHTINMYLNMIPLQEREEWLSEWSTAGEMPLMPVEFGVPQFNTFLRGRNGFGNNIVSEPLLTEFAAIYFGKQAYADEPTAYRDGMLTRFKEGQTYASWNAGGELLTQSKNMQAITRLFVGNTLRSWRTWGITGGMIPWDQGYTWTYHSEHNKPAAARFVPGERGRFSPQLPTAATAPFEPPFATLTPTGEVMRQNNAATLAWIAGGAGEGFTDKDHLFAAGGKVEKQIAILNDERAERQYTGTWRATLDGKEVATGRIAGRVGPATNVFAPVAFDLPGAVGGATRDGTLEIDVRIGEAVHKDAFAFRVFAPPTAAARAVATIDPRGLTTKMLRTAGVDVSPWSATGTSPVIVVGRQALDEDPQTLGSVEKQVRAGATAIVFGQSPDVLSRYFGFRTSPHLTRRAFTVSNGHPVTAGLDAEDLRDWNGASTLVEARPDLTGPEVRIGPSCPYYGWRWGNRGAVATGAIEKPHHSGWTPIIECEFDLAYSPLMELRVGAGRVIWCQLDLEDQIQTPPARELLDQLLAYAATRRDTPASGVATYVGDEAGKRLLESLALSFKPSGTLPEAAGLVVLGGGADVSDGALRAYLERGGRVVVLPRSEDRGPLGVTYARGKSTGSLKVPAWPEAAGLSASDLRLRNVADVNLVAGGGEVGADGLLARVTVGRGSAVFTAIDPTLLDADAKTYLRFSRWRQTRALSQVLTNMGGEFVGDRRVFEPFDGMEPAVPVAGTWQAKYVQRIDDVKNETHPDPGMSAAAEKLCALDVDDAGWAKVKAPGTLEENGAPWTDANGEIVLRKTIDVPAEMASRELVLELGAIDDFDVTFVNGQRVGGSPDGKTSQWNVERQYRLPPGLIQPGKNVIAVRVWDQFGGGGFNGPVTKMRLTPPPRGDAAPLYHRDYRTDFELGDDPYRYYRW